MIYVGVITPGDFPNIFSVVHVDYFGVIKLLLRFAFVSASKKRSRKRLSRLVYQDHYNVLLTKLLSTAESSFAAACLTTYQGNLQM